MFPVGYYNKTSKLNFFLENICCNNIFFCVKINFIPYTVSVITFTSFSIALFALINGRLFWCIVQLQLDDDLYLTITNTKHIVPSANISAVKLTAMTFIWLFNCHLDVLVVNTVLFIFTDVYWYKKYIPLPIIDSNNE